MATSDQRNKWKCEELAAALSGSKKLSALGFVINPNKRTRQRLSQALKHRMMPLLCIPHSSQQVNPVNPCTNIRRRHHYGSSLHHYPPYPPGTLEIGPELLLTPFGNTPLIRRSARE